MSSDTKFHIHHDAPEVVGRRERLGVRILIVADGAFLFGLVFSYFYLRNLNTNNGWIPKNGHHFSSGSAWQVGIPFVIAAISHKMGARNKSIFPVTSLVTFLVLLIGGYLQWKQMAHMPFVVKDDAGVTSYEGAYASSWVLFAGAGMFHFLLGGFIALGIFLRGRRNDLNEVLDGWRQKSAGSWFTWIAISGVISAITLSII